MCFKLAYPNGDARLLVTAMSRSGNRICFEGKMAGIRRAPVLGSLGADATRYTKPVIAANADCTVLRKMAYVKRAFVGPWDVVVRRSWSIAQLILPVD